MQQIEVNVLNKQIIKDIDRMTVATARLTQRGHNIKNMDDLEELLNKEYKESTLLRMTELPHPTIQKFGVINMAIVGASRRFLAQITRHQNEVKFMSASLQYSDYSGAASFVVPYGVTVMDHEKPALNAYDEPIENYWRTQYINSCMQGFAEYEASIAAGLDRDSAGYIMPQGMRNILIVSATAYQWKHMISQRICRRNTDETRYVMLLCWNALLNESDLFWNCGPSCMTREVCDEGNFSCGRFIHEDSPAGILAADFKYII